MYDMLFMAALYAAILLLPTAHASVPLVTVARAAYLLMASNFICVVRDCCIILKVDAAVYACGLNGHVAFSAVLII
jgi:hypothetical protein